MFDGSVICVLTGAGGKQQEPTVDRQDIGGWIWDMVYMYIGLFGIWGVWDMGCVGYGGVWDIGSLLYMGVHVIWECVGYGSM